MKIHTSDRASAEKWLKEVEELNNETEATVKAAGQAVKNISEMADGSLIDELVLGGDKLMTIAVDLSKTMSGFTSMVNNILNIGEDFVKNGPKYIKDAFKNILK